MNSMIHSAVGCVEEKEAMPLKVAMAMKPVMRKMAREERRRDYRVYGRVVSLWRRVGKATQDAYPEGKRCSVFGKLESHKAVDEEAPVGGADES